MLHKIPDSVSFEQGALVEPSAVALYAVQQSTFKVGDKAAVFGAGPIGLLIIEALRAAGASEIYVSEVSAERKKMAADFGAIVLNPKETDVVEEIRDRTDGGVDVSFEVSGIDPVLTQSINAAKVGGEAMIVSIFENRASIDPKDIVLNERKVTGIIGYRNIFPAVISLMEQGYFSADKIVTKKITLDRVVDEGFDALLKERNQVKILVKAQ
jgi:(R,R)-butanediol dehydrogenase/meso-butanediol dehydrogenase/diacetyl reductase